MKAPKYQMMERTWQTMLKRFGAACGVPLDTPRTDDVAREKLLAAYIEENKSYIQNKKVNNE